MPELALHKKQRQSKLQKRKPCESIVENEAQISEEEKKLLDLLSEILTSKIINDAQNQCKPRCGGLHTD